MEACDRELVAFGEVDLDRVDDVLLKPLTTMGEPALMITLPGESERPFRAGSQYSSTGTSMIVWSRRMSSRMKLVVGEVVGEEHLSVVDGEHDHVHVEMLRDRALDQNGVSSSISASMAARVRAEAGKSARSSCILEPVLPDRAFSRPCRGREVRRCSARSTPVRRRTRLGSRVDRALRSRSTRGL